MFKLSPRERNYEIVDQSVFGFNLSRTILAYLFCQSHMSSTRGGTLSERLNRTNVIISAFMINRLTFPKCFLR